jgi:hypothetical protein
MKLKGKKENIRWAQSLSHNKKKKEERTLE